MKIELAKEGHPFKAWRIHGHEANSHNENGFVGIPEALIDRVIGDAEPETYSAITCYGYERQARSARKIAS